MNPRGVAAIAAACSGRLPRCADRLARGALLGALHIAIGACTMRVAPPPAPADPVAIFIVDHGYHSSLLLPDGAGGLSEFAYGEWEWFALGREQWHRVPAVLFWPTQGTLGRRAVPARPVAREVAERVAAEAVHELFVSAQRVDALRGSLEARIEASAGTRVHNLSYGLEMAPVDPPYSILHHCNSEVADWLRELGCRTCGAPLIAEFEVAPPR